MIWSQRRRISCVAVAACAAISNPLPGQRLPARTAGPGIVVGFEYALLDNQRLVANMAAAFADAGLTGMKHYVESVQWGEMQRGPNAAIDFTKLDWFVREYQTRGFTELTISLKPHSEWASKDVKKLRASNAAPKAEYRALFSSWVTSVVERYDGDGKDDMPSLRWPVRFVEIGNEFSSYEPEPVDEYLDLLKLAYEAAHRASTTVQVGHAAFLTTPVNLDVASPRDYDAAWKATRRVDTTHDLGDIRKILDHPELFDFINLHNLGDPYEIEHQMRWLAYETSKRGYVRPVIISDTLPTSYAGWGAATTCTGGGLSVMVPPARESDRCRLASYFTKLVNKDAATLEWTRAFVAADQVQRTIIAAEQGVKVINLSFVSDIGIATLPVFRAGAGVSAWGGAIGTNIFASVTDRFPLFYAVKQMMGHINGYRSINRVVLANAQARVYRIERRDGTSWVVWRDPQAVLLPEDGAPSLTVRLPISASSATIEPTITRIGQATAASASLPVTNGQVELVLTHTPIYVSSR
ncbi:MAG: hypothetical protein V4550_02805 [Gemmatimonadota bacterium]